MRERTFKELLGKCTILPPINKPKFPSAQNCVIPLCQSCLLACASKRTPNVKHSTAYLENEEALSCNRYEVGDLFPLISSFTRPLAGCLKGMAVSQEIGVFRG
jgi:hypothetical protein